MLAYNRSLHGPDGNASTAKPKRRPSRCPNLVGFLAICAKDYSSDAFRLPPTFLGSNPALDDILFTGGSVHFRKVLTETFQAEVRKTLPDDRKYVAVKHPVMYNDDHTRRQELYSDIATELQVLCHLKLKGHANIPEFYGLMYNEVGEDDRSIIVPALVMEYAEFGSVKTYQELGYATSLLDKTDIILDASHGLHALHEAGIIHCDIKSSNLLVCKHPTRKFIVKVTDFGYAITREDLRSIGYTENFEAPETSGDLDPKYGCQIDIYSFGILVYTVFKNGKQYFDIIDKSIRKESVHQMRDAGFLPVLFQLNLLLHMKNEKCPLLVICRILNYCLQPDPSRRYYSVKRITGLMEQFKKGVLIGTMVSGEQIEAGKVRKMQDFHQNSMMRLKKNYLSSFSEEHIEMPMIEALSAEMENRIQREVEMYLGNIQPIDGRALAPYSRDKDFSLLISSLGLSRETMLAYKMVPDTERNSQDIPGYAFSTEFMFDISVINATFMKFPEPLQRAIFEDLENITQTSISNDVKAAAKLNLAICSINGYGSPFDLNVACRLILESARLGNEYSQILYVDIFQHFSVATSLSGTEELSWLKSAAASGDVLALKRAKTLSKSNMEEIEENYRTSMTRTLSHELKSIRHFAEVTTLQAMTHQKDLMNLAIIYESVDLIKDLIAVNPTLIGQVIVDNKTPLLLAASLGQASALALLISLGASASIVDEEGTSALHYLVAFPNNSKELVADVLLGNGADIDAKVTRGNNGRTWHRSVLDTPIAGTPLHWAIVDDDLVSVDILLRRGAQAMERSGQDANTGRTPLELACAMTRSAIVARLLEEPHVCTQVSSDGEVILGAQDLKILPIAQVARPRTRWRRILECGVNYEAEAKRTMLAFRDKGLRFDVTERYGQHCKTLVLAITQNHCNADMMKSAFELGLRRDIDSKFSPAAKGPALVEAIGHHDRDMFDYLLDQGADINTLGSNGWSALQAAAQASNEVYFSQKLLGKGASVDPSSATVPSAFYMAVWAGNYDVATLLFNHGADRDRMLSGEPGPHKSPSILGRMIWCRNHNATERVRYLLKLANRPHSPSQLDTPASDGFIVSKPRGWKMSALHSAISVTTENPDDNEITRVLVHHLLTKYGSKPDYVNSTDGPHHGTPLSMAAEIGNFAVVRQLLDDGDADPNIPDELGRTPLDLVMARFYYPTLMPAFLKLTDDEIEDRLLVGRVLAFVNTNTAEVRGLLEEYGAELGVFQRPKWADVEAEMNGVMADKVEPRSLDWVMVRLKEDREKKKKMEEEENNTEGQDTTIPAWAGSPIKIPDRPMQFIEGPG